MSDEKKIIIDEDWKSQVQAEREAVAKGLSAGANESAAATSGDASSADPQMPPASFEMLITSLATESLVAMGQVPHPVTGKAELQRNHAQYLIDMLDMLRQKTKGNLAAEEQQLMDEVLHQVRMVFIAVASQPAVDKIEAKEKTTPSRLAAGKLCPRCRIIVTCTPLPFDDGGSGRQNVPNWV